MKPEIRLEKEIRKNKKLCEFLIQHKAYDKFIKNAIDDIKRTNASEGHIINITRRARNPITLAFPWNETSEGDRYWRKLCNEYIFFSI